LGVLRWAYGRGDDTLGIAQRLGRSLRAVAVIMGFALAVAITTTSVVLAIYQPQTNRDVDGRSGAKLALQGMLDQQAGLRGYLLSGDPGLLDSYRRGQAEVSAGDAALEANLGNNSAVATQLSLTRSAEELWTQGWAQPLAEVAPPSTAVPPSVLQRGSALFSAYRSSADGLIAAASAQYQASRRAESVALWSGAVLEALIFSLLLLLVVREHRRLRASLVSPVASLLQAMRTARDGDLSARAAEQGPAELRQVAAGLNEMTRALAEERSLRASRETEVMYQSTRLREMLEMARNLAGSLNLRYVLDAASTHAVSVSGHQQATIWLMDEESPRLVAGLSATAGGTGPAEREPVQLGEGCVGQAARFGRAVTGRGGVPTDPPESRSVMAVPMIVGARVVGVIELSSTHAYTVPTASLSLVETLASHAGTAIEAARLHARTEELTQVDALTRLYNRRRLEIDMDRECKRSRRYDRPMAFCMLDVDHFKRFNDQHGHRRGDEVLEEVGRLLRDGIRSSDSAYRYGGEEFGLLLRDTTLGAAVALCERLRTRIAARFAGNRQITASFGVAVLTPSMQGPADLVEAADRALYRAKSLGRDRVVAEEDAGAAARGNGDAGSSRPQQT